MLKKLLIASALSTLSLGIALGSPTPALAIAPSTAEVELTDIETALVPTRLVRGDREFGGNGPNIISRVRLEVSRDRRSILAKIYFKATETKSDWSTTEANWTRTVFRAPSGKTIDRILSPTSSEVRFTSRKAGFQILGPGDDFKRFVTELEKIVNAVLDAERTLSNRSSDTREVRDARRFLGQVESATAGLNFQGNHVHTVHPTTDGPVNVFAIVGDTGGDDISKDDNPKDDTRIQAIKFNKVRVRYR
ncbi:MAG: hypothetical protein AB1Z98_23175 [Nannocystaceae bacterium]